MGALRVRSCAKAQSVERRWQRFMSNARIRVEALYLPLVMVALSGWQQERVYLALDRSVEPLLYDSSVGGLLWASRPLAMASVGHNSATVAFSEYRRLLRTARWLLRRHPDVMLLADRGNACS